MARFSFLPPRPRLRAGGLVAGLGLFVALSSCGSDPLAPDPGLSIGCEPGVPLDLQVGESRRTHGSAASELCIQGPPGGGEYVLVATWGATPSTTTARLRITGDSLAPTMGPPVPLLDPSPVLSERLALRGPERPDDGAFHAGLRAQERRELLHRVGPPGVPEPQLAPGLAPAGVPAVGSLITLNTQSGSGKACMDPVYRTGEVMAISQRALVVADTMNPAGGFSRGDYEHLAAVFDTLVVPVTDQYFGDPTDLDGNGRTILFFTQEVNRLTDAESDRFVGGFFFARDLFSRAGSSRLEPCATSNEAELLYLMVPEPGRNPESVWGRAAVRRNVPSTMAHEQQHLINAARRLHIRQSPTPFEETWLNEGLSHAAEELVFFRAAGLGPRRNLGFDELQAGGARAIDAANAHQLPNVLRFERFLRAPDRRSPYDEDDTLEARGAAQQFLRYAADRRGGPDAEFFRSLVDAPDGGTENLAARLGGPTALHEWLADWTVAIYADSRVPGLEPRHRLQSWNHPSLFQQLRIEPYPIRTRALRSGTPVEVELVGGGSVHLRFGAAEGEGAVVRIAVDQAPPPSQFRVTLLRTR